MPAPTALGPANETAGRADGATDGLAGGETFTEILHSKQRNASLAEVPGSAAGLFHLWAMESLLVRDHSGSIYPPPKLCVPRLDMQPNSLSVNLLPLPTHTHLDFRCAPTNSLSRSVQSPGYLIHRHGASNSPNLKYITPPRAASAAPFSSFSSSTTLERSVLSSFYTVRQSYYHQASPAFFRHSFLISFESSLCACGRLRPSLLLPTN